MRLHLLAPAGAAPRPPVLTLRSLVIVKLKVFSRSQQSDTTFAERLTERLQAESINNAARPGMVAP